MIAISQWSNVLTKRNSFLWQVLSDKCFSRTNVLRVKRKKLHCWTNDSCWLSCLVNTMKYRASQSEKGIELERVTGKNQTTRRNSPTDFQRVFPIFRVFATSVFPCYDFHAPNRFACVYLLSRQWDLSNFFEFHQVYATLRILAEQNTVFDEKSRQARAL